HQHCLLARREDHCSADSRSSGVVGDGNSADAYRPVINGREQLARRSSRLGRSTLCTTGRPELERACPTVRHELWLRRNRRTHCRMRFHLPSYALGLATGIAVNTARDRLRPVLVEMAAVAMTFSKVGWALI